MDNLIDLRAYLARLAQEFDQTLHASAADPNCKGWGQFLSGESHQIGLYGTCSGVLVKSIGAPSSPIDQGVVEYLVTQWRDRANNSQRYFNQTIRLSFLVLALARIKIPELITIRNDAVRELETRQRSDGAWGDWGSSAPPRLETTAWAVLALARVGEIHADAVARKGATFLHRQALAVPIIDEMIDPFILGVIFHILTRDTISRRIVSAAIKILAYSRPTNELQVYFIDYVISDTTEMRRDYICVPRFFGYCLLASAQTLGPEAFSSAGLHVAIAHRRAMVHLNEILAVGLLRTSASRFPSTVDQAFVALSVEYITVHQPRFEGVIRWGRPIYHRLHDNFVVRVILPPIILSFFVAVTHEPRNLVDLTAWVPGTEYLSNFTEHHLAVIQFTAILAGLLVGKPLINGFWRFLNDKWGA
jgi:hypothetical protein